MNLRQANHVVALQEDNQVISGPVWGLQRRLIDVEDVSLHLTLFVPDVELRTGEHVMALLASVKIQHPEPSTHCLAQTCRVW